MEYLTQDSNKVHLKYYHDRNRGASGVGGRIPCYQTSQYSTVFLSHDKNNTNHSKKKLGTIRAVVDL